MPERVNLLAPVLVKAPAEVSDIIPAKAVSEVLLAVSVLEVPKVIEELGQIADICNTREDDNKENHEFKKFENKKKFGNKRKFGNRNKFGNRRKFRNKKKFGNNKDNVDIF